MSYELTSLQLKIIGICWRKATCYYSFSFLISTFILHSELTEHNKCSCTYIAWSAPFVTSCEVVRKLGSFRLIAPRWPSTAAGAVSLKGLTKCEEVRKWADQANSACFCLFFWFVTRNWKSWLEWYRRAKCLLHSDELRTPIHRPQQKLEIEILLLS